MITGALLPSSRPTFLRGRPALDRPPDVGRAGERDHGDVVVVHQRIADHAAAAGDDVDPARREPALVDQQLDEADGRQRGLRRRLQHHRTARRDRRRQLVGDEVQREVERGDRPDDPDGHPQREAELAVAGRRAGHRHDVTGERAGLDRREAERLDGAGGLGPGRGDRLGRLLGDDPGQLLVALGDDAHRSLEHLGPLVRAASGSANRSLAIATARSTCSGVHTGTRPMTCPS